MNTKIIFASGFLAITTLSLLIVGAGMQGDRASVVFAASNEISTLIRFECAEQNDRA